MATRITRSVVVKKAEGTHTAEKVFIEVTESDATTAIREYKIVMEGLTK